MVVGCGRGLKGGDFLGNFGYGVWMVGVWAPVGGFLLSSVETYQRDVVSRRWLSFLEAVGCGVFIWTFSSWVCTIRRGTCHGLGYHEIFGRRWLLGGFYLLFSYSLIAFSFVSESR
ncbi:hypothetical protein F5144DRAFT_582980 [Chaetomium tenue]|uniref:Uncharacterized protein n=1 Tax=Chaetomium tenue TaxID=1854479 RepID=A0ACB7P2U9_9PEZI|nr:hypothetical protein F5144DRAFT_582980 [Chaetomium globosum]